MTKAEYNLKRKLRRLNDPEWAQKERDRQAEYRKDPAFRKRADDRKKKWIAANKECHAELVKRWNQSHRGKMNGYAKKYEANNRERRKELRNKREPDVAIRRVARQLGRGELDLDAALKQIRETFDGFNGKGRASSAGDGSVSESLGLDNSGSG